MGQREREEPLSVMVVDSGRIDRELVRNALGSDLAVIEHARGDEALESARRHPPDLFLLEVVLPPAGGFELCRSIRSDPKLTWIPVVFLTAQRGLRDEIDGFASGASDYLNKPVRVEVLRARVWALLGRSLAERDLDRRYRQVFLFHELSLVGLTAFAETGNDETVHHLLRVRYYVEALCRALQTHPRFEEILTPDAVRQISLSAPLHDLGKVGLPPGLLTQPRRLNPEERAQIQGHCELGWKTLARYEETMGTSIPEFDVARDLILGHHEWWDGSGYPAGLRGEKIPACARILAVADVYDALVSRRPYKEPWPEARVVRTLRRRSGTQFDPAVVEAFLGLTEEFHRIHLAFLDHRSFSPVGVSR